MKLLRFLLILGSALVLCGRVTAAEPGLRERPTIVLVHGAMADASSWDDVILKLQADGFPVLAAANPLRGLKSDSQYVAQILTRVQRPVVLVGHSYGGSVISNAANGHDNVKALVFVAAFAPDVGESAFDLVGRNPGSTLGAALQAPLPLPGGGNDLYVQPDQFKGPFAEDLPEVRVKLLAATQRPVTDTALKEPSGEPAWKKLPSWFIYGSADNSIPPDTQAFMARRAKAKEVLVERGASHMLMVSRAAAVAKVIENASNAY